MLEILSLQSLNPNLPPNPSEKQRKKDKKKKKKKNSRGKPDGATDPDMHLELLVDRLCIWHSIGPDPTLKEDDSNKPDTVPEKDHLRNFSMEVIMPLCVAFSL